MRLLPTTLPAPKTTNPNLPAPALVHLAEPPKTGVNIKNWNKEFGYFNCLGSFLIAVS